MKLALPLSFRAKTGFGLTRPPVASTKDEQQKRLVSRCEQMLRRCERRLLVDGVDRDVQEKVARLYTKVGWTVRIMTNDTMLFVGPEE